MSDKMNRAKKLRRSMPHLIPLVQWVFSVFVILMGSLTIHTPGMAQEKHLIQIKTFDQQLQPIKNIDLSINGKEYISIGNKGTAFIELQNSELPLKSVKIKGDELEAASWNFSKGIVEIIIRKKNHKVTQWVLKDQSNTSTANLKITFIGKKTITITTNNEGRFELPLALDEKVNSATQFAINDYQMVNFQLSDALNTLTIEKVKPVLPTAELPVAKNNKQVTPRQEYFKDFDLSKLDSIQSLTVFYAIFKNYQIKDMDAETRRKVDAKFNQLVALLQDSIRRKETPFIGRISDSSFVGEDIKNLLSQAREENRTLAVQRTEFDEKIKVISNKLSSGLSTLDDNTRTELLSDLALLERLLVENESRFYKNQNDYRVIINALKEKYFNFQDLEHKLSESEAQRLEEQRVFKQRVLIILAVAFVFGVLVVLLIYFSNHLRKQKKALVLANDEIKRINENLEGIISQRTRLLAEAHRELDTFLYRASHDLRSPVCSIIGLCNIATHLSDGEPKELIQKVVNTTIGMDRLLKKLSIISEINQPSNFSSITLVDMVENVRHHFKKVIQENDVRFMIDCPADLVVYSYPNLLQTILANLIENALFYSSIKNDGNASVEFSAVIKGNNLVFAVYDNGVGVNDTIGPKLYDMFFKGNENSKGNGLGLYIVQKSIQALEGSITFESEPLQYTKFIVHLPLKDIPVSDAHGKGLQSTPHVVSTSPY
jgi:signal transduction histidine kinase